MQRVASCLVLLVTALQEGCVPDSGAALLALDTKSYVSPDGDDHGSGSREHPFRTLRFAAGKLLSGQTLVVDAGVYAESLSDAIVGGASWSQPTRIVAAAGARVVVQPPPGSEFVLHFSRPSSSFISIEGLILDGTNVAYDVVKITSDNRVDAAHAIRLQHCEVRNAPFGQGVLVTNLSDDNEFLELDVHHNGTLDETWSARPGHCGHGYYLSASRNRIVGGHVHDNCYYGVQIYSGYPGQRVDDTWIEGVTFTGNGGVAGGGRGGGLVISTGARTTVVDTVVKGNYDGVFVAYNDVRDTRLSHMTVKDNTDLGIYIGPDASGTVMCGNESTGNGAGDFEDHGHDSREECR